MDPSSGIPLYLQLKQLIIRKIIKGVWEPEHQLPTVRQMAVDVCINVNTVSRVYGEVEREGYIRTQQGKGTFVQRAEFWKEDLQDRTKFTLRFANSVLEMAQAQGITLTELIETLRTLQDGKNQT